MQKYKNSLIPICAFSLISALSQFFPLRILAYPNAPANSPHSMAQNPPGIATDKSENEIAARALAEADDLRARWEAPSLYEAVKKYEESASLWGVAAPGKAARSLQKAGDVYFILSNYDKALLSYKRALTFSKAAQDEVLDLQVLNSIAYAHVYLGENQKALNYTNKVREECKHFPWSDINVSRRVEAQALNNLGEIYYALGDLKGSLKVLAEALGLWASLHDGPGLALVHLNLGYSYTDMGNLREASEHYSQSLALSQEMGDRRGVALATTAVGGIYSFRGDKQAALDSHFEALNLFRIMGNQQGEAAALNGVGQAYEDLSEYKMALENYQRALDLNRTIGNRDFMALDEYYIGRVYALMKENSRGLSSYIAALDLSRSVGDRQIEAHILRGIGIIKSAEGKNHLALAEFSKAMTIYDQIGDRRSKAYTLNSIGHLYSVLGEEQRAQACFQLALPLVRAAEDKKGEALTLYNLASIERDRGNLEAGLALIKESVHIVESSRSKIDSRDLRTSYFAYTHKHYELYIDLLMQIARARSDSNYVVDGLLASEQSRARALLDTITVTGPGRSEASYNQLLSREESLTEQRDAKTEYRTRLLNGNAPSTETQEVSDEIHRLNDEYELVRAEIRKQNPRYAAFTQPETLSVQKIKDGLDPAREILLEFSLGDKRSYLWLVSATAIQSYELPARATIERYADEVYGLLTIRQQIEAGEIVNRPGLLESSDLEYEKKAAALGVVLLGPVVAQLGSKRLIIVADGGLQHIPLEALPVPSVKPGNTDIKRSESRLLIDDHEIVQVPSASVLGAIRQEKRVISSVDKTVFVLADPVFERDDPRVTQTSKARAVTPSVRIDQEYIRKALNISRQAESESDGIPRLAGSLREAKSIIDMASPAEATLVTSFEATRTRIMSEELKHYRIIHFATHGVLDSERPEASGLILAMVDKTGDPQDGYLKLTDVYGLDVSADLVVLSACRTRLGPSVEGEGVMGLARGFLYAGSKSVVASLWKVDDEATAELMKTFYAAMLKEGLPPSSALRNAKQTLRTQKRWRSPFYWGAFVLDGQYNDSLIRRQNGANRRIYYLLAALTICLGIFALWSWRRRKIPFV